MALGFWRLAGEDPGHLALVESDGTEQTAGELLAACNQVAHGLRAAGVGRGDTVAGLLPNGAPFVELYLGVMQLGAYLVPINWHLAPPEIQYIVEDSESKVFVDSADALAKLKDGQPTDLPDDRWAGTVMNYTSGTTGRPKGVRRGLVDLDPDTNAELHTFLLNLFNITPHDDNVHLVAAPLYHTAVLNFGSASLNMGHTLVLMDKWTPEGTLERIERYKVTTTHMVPTMFHRMLALPDEVKAKYDVSSLRQVIHSAAPCPIDVKHRMLEWWGPTIYEYYAATEGGGTLVTPEEWLQKPGTVGKPWPISEVKVFDDDGNELAPGQIGTVYMKMGDYQFEYHGDKEKTEKSWKDGYFTVGDAGELDEDGWLFLRDRKSDMIISGGVNIYPAEIEGELLTHPSVGDVAVFGIPDDDWGEQIKAVVEPSEGVTPGPDLEAELIGFLADRVAKYKIPKSVDFVAELPRDPNGKLYKRKLRDPYWAGKERQI
jgi:long-chain acyl-CoA synthetase